ncbi:hypothetical protein FCM35_KLT08064 [Carex littledalei]|uniref:Uncharacterized protein n=1 Tax=Carex littledalei TaxID=544730 RepID=A0A833QX08_9POAL|nr:hypothetical protein FCM35_KLT08064 [Carex littledalei]
MFPLYLAVSKSCQDGSEGPHLYHFLFLFTLAVTVASLPRTLTKVWAPLDYATSFLPCISRPSVCLHWFLLQILKGSPIDNG